MTTDLQGQVLAKIDKDEEEMQIQNRINRGWKSGGDFMAESYQRLIRAVVEIHGDDGNGNCKVCGIILFPHEVRYERVPFPCPTFRAIGKELGVPNDAE